MGWFSQTGAVPVGVHYPASNAPCRVNLPAANVQDVGDVNGDGVLDVAIVKSCPYCTSSYLIAAGVR
jgi:hypothetical protein